MDQPVLYRAHPTKRLPDAIVVVPVDAPVDQREHLPTGALLPSPGVDGPDPHPVEVYVIEQRCSASALVPVHRERSI